MNYGGKYLKIRKAIHEAGFDEFHQAGSVSRFHKMNIVAESAVLGKRFWFCIDGGYGVGDEMNITVMEVYTDNFDVRYCCGSQEEMVNHIQAIQKEIQEMKSDRSKRVALVGKWLEHISKGIDASGRDALLCARDLLLEMDADISRLKTGLSVSTPMGSLVATPSGYEADYPGIWIELRRDGCGADAPLALVEYTATEGDLSEPAIITRVWDDVGLDEYQTRRIHEGIEKYFAKEGESNETN